MSTPNRIDLAGQWQYHLEAAGSPSSGTIHLPGSLELARIGMPVQVDTPWTGGVVDRSFYESSRYAPYRRPGKIEVPFWLQPDTVYRGGAMFERDVAVPEGWRGKHVRLFLERAHWETHAWVDGRDCGLNDSLGTAHIHDLGTLAPGTHRLKVRVDNRMVVELGQDSHSVSDHTQGNWNGLVGDLSLQATEPTWIEDLQVFPRVSDRSVRIVGMIGGDPYEGSVRLNIGRKSVVTRVARGRFESTLALGPDAKLWDEFSPNLLNLTAKLDNGEMKAVRFGLREFGTEGTTFTINGRPTSIRGTLDCAAFPRTGHPPTDVASWKRILRTLKSYGLNEVRFHSWCPPEAAFDAADELGVYFHVECSSWGRPGSIPELNAWLYRETDAMLKAYGNHPSYLMALYGNEPGGDEANAYLAEWVKHYREKDPRRLYSSGSGWPQLPENQFHVTPDPRIQLWGQGMGSRINSLAPETVTDYHQYIAERSVPVVSHEIGQWCVYPNFAEMRKYTGYLKPKNYEIFRDFLTQGGMAGQARMFFMASGKLQTLCYKEEIESALRTPGMGGFELLGLEDFPGQGTALVGVLDTFYAPKPYVSASEYRRFCNSTVPLARLEKRVFTNNESLTATLEVAHFGSAPIEGANATCRLVREDGKVVAEKKLGPITIGLGHAQRLGSVAFQLRGIESSTKLRLVLSLDGTPFENDWDVWVYPAKVVSPKADVTIVRTLDEATTALVRGDKVLWRVDPNEIAGDVALGFSSIFWNTAWTSGQPPHTLGVLVDPKNPVFASFPTEYHSNWQWWYLMHGAGAMVLDGLPKTLRPTVQVIDDWFQVRKLGLLVEARVGSGRLAMTTIDLDADNPVTRQFRASLMSYLGSEEFHPSIDVSTTQLRSILKP